MKLITNNERTAIEFEIQAHENIKQAQVLLYEGLNFDIKEIKRDFSFGVMFSHLKKVIYGQRTTMISCMLIQQNV